MAIRELPRRREGTTVKFQVENVEGYVSCGEFEDGSLGEIFVTISKQGSTLRGWADAFAITFSGALQHAADPKTALKWLTDNLTDLRFDPGGQTDDPDLPQARSIIDYIARKLAEIYL